MCSGNTTHCTAKKEAVARAREYDKNPQGVALRVRQGNIFYAHFRYTKGLFFDTIERLNMAKTKLKKVKETAPKSGGSSYGAADITVLEGLEAGRRRPGMYIGTTGTAGLPHRFWEGLDNTRNKYISGFS